VFRSCGARSLASGPLTTKDVCALIRFNLYPPCPNVLSYNIKPLFRINACKTNKYFIEETLSDHTQTHSPTLTIERTQRLILKVSAFRSFLFATHPLYKSCNILVLTMWKLFIMSIVLRQHTALPYCTDHTNKRRKNIVCTLETTTNHAFPSKFYISLGPVSTIS
jgi:hypothetical protein